VRGDSPERIPGGIASLAWTPDGLAIGGCGGRLHLLGPDLNTSWFRLRGQVAALTALPDGRIAAAGPLNRAVLVWHPGTGSLDWYPAPRVRCLAWTSSGLAAGTTDGRVLWLPAGESLALNGGPVNALAAWGEHVAVGCQDGGVRLLPDRLLLRHEGEVTALAFAAGRVASGGQGGRVYLHHVLDSE
ncbi:MAG: hypothetical protein AB1758_19175, partial [Candidatus Eremiobacterota bacterium]